MKPSSHERWFDTTTAGPVAGSRSAWTTRKRWVAFTIDATKIRSDARGAA